MKTAKQKNRVSALLPILVFLIIYIGVGIYYEYIRPQRQERSPMRS